MTRSNTAIFVLLITVYTSSGFAQSVDPIDELKACARITDREARYACFDTLGEQVLREESGDDTPTEEEVTQSESAASATVANAQPRPAKPDVATLGEIQESKRIEYSGKITSCKQGVYGNWYFIFDNGQTWKEVNKRNRRFKECNFDVTITKDTFGYKMRIEALEKTLRVRRHK